jgi:transcriptional regulator with XRE-family HTH domain
MPTSGRDPLKVPVQFWQRPDVTETLEARDIARLFRLLRKYCGASQTRIGTTVGMTQSTVSLIISRNTPVTTIAVLERIADGLAMPDESRMRLGTRAEGGRHRALTHRAGHRPGQHPNESYRVGRTAATSAPAPPRA